MSKEDLDIGFSEGGEEVLEYAMDVYGQALLRYCHNILCDYEFKSEVKTKIVTKQRPLAMRRKYDHINTNRKRYYQSKVATQYVLNRR